MVLADEGKHEQAVAIYLEYLGPLEQAYDKDSYPVGVVCRNLGVSLTALDRFDEAETYLLRAVPIYTAIYGDHNERMKTVIDPMVTLYDRWGRDDDRDAWTKRRALIPDTPK
jgi:hypothetical protein